MTKVSVCHLTSVHQRFDTRIFLKECKSLSTNGWDVSLIVADGKGDELKEGIHIYDVGKIKNRFKRILRSPKLVFKKAVLLDAQIYHFHDPELIPVGLKLKRCGKRVIFDVHEDVPLQLLEKPYLKAPLRQLLSLGFKLYQSFASRRFDAIVTATPTIRGKFEKLNGIVSEINNFPITGELKTESIEWAARKNQVCYVGGLTAVRGIKELVHAVSMVRSGTILLFAGSFMESNFEKEVKSMPVWDNVEYKGFLDRQGVRKLLKESLAGLVTLLPTRNFRDSLPIKMFEYMSAGIPVIASNFPLWRKILEENTCGICVDPKNPQDIADAIDYIVAHPDEAQGMGENGRKAVISKYNWSIEEKKLIELYEKLARE